MNGEQTINLNATQCFKSQTNMTETVVHNICENTTHVVPHGTVDYLGISVIALVLAMGFALVIAFLKMIFE